MKLIRIKVNFLIQCWQEVMAIKTFRTCMIPLGQSTCTPPIYSALSTATLQNFMEVVITNLRFLVDYSCKEYKFMLGVT